MKKFIKRPFPKLNIQILANCPVSAQSMGGGDRIMIENARHWQKWGNNIFLWGCEEAIDMVKNNNLNVNFKVLSNLSAKRWGIYLAYLLRIWHGLFHPLKPEEGSILYSASEFLPDVIGPFLAKKRYKFKWVVGFYLIYQNPFTGETHFTFRKAITFLSQRLALFLIKKRTDRVWVLCREDLEKLTLLGVKKGRIKIISAGVDCDFINKIPKQRIEYDGCFVGRFHPQKGLPDLLLAWREVVNEIPLAKLAVIGWGEEYWNSFLRKEIKKLKLENNIDLIGFLDGSVKYKVLKQSRVFLLPSHQESWGLVGIESMAAGLPVVSYNLPIFKETYGKALLEAPLGDFKKLAQNTIRLLKDRKFYEKMKEASLQMASKFSWDKVAKENLYALEGL